MHRNVALVYDNYWHVLGMCHMTSMNTENMSAKWREEYRRLCYCREGSATVEEARYYCCWQETNEGSRNNDNAVSGSIWNVTKGQILGGGGITGFKYDNYTAMKVVSRHILVKLLELWENSVQKRTTRVASCTYQRHTKSNALIAWSGV